MIRINVPDFVSYRAGSRVSGTVTIDQAVAANVQRVSISLQGSSQTEIDGSISVGPSGTKSSKHCGGSVSLFRQQLDLFDGPKTPHGLDAWPFSFTFPGNYNPSSADVSALGESWINSVSNQPLPPSCSNLHTLKSGGHYRYLIFYELEASFQTQDSSQRMMPPVSVTRRLTYLSSPSINLSISRPKSIGHWITCQSRALPAKSERESAIVPRTLGERFRKTIRPDESPKATFRLELMVPTMAAVNQVLPLVLSVDHDIEHSTTPSPPSVMFKRARVTLKVKSEINCSDGKCKTDWEREYVVIDHTPLKPIMIKQNMELKDCRLKDDLIPSFISFNVQVKHSLVVELTVQCALKSFVIDFSTDDSLILLADGPNLGGQRSGLPQSGPLPSFDLDLPPQYEP